MMLSLVAVALPLAGVANANHGVCDLNISPENDTNPTGTTHTLTATLVESSANNETAAPCNDIRNNAITIDFEIDCVSGAGANYTGETSGNAENAGGAECGANDAPGAGDDIRTTLDMSCQIDPNPVGAGDAASNSCTVSYSRDTDGQDEIVGWVDEDQNDTTDNSDPNETLADADNDTTDVVEKFWSDPTQQQINCSNDTGLGANEGETNPAGTQHQVTCTVRSANVTNPPLEGADVDFRVVGVNPLGPQHACTTGANGTCTFNYTGNNPGHDDIQAWVNQDASHTDNDCGAEATGEPENNDFCDQVEKNWLARTATFVNADPETDTNPNGSQHQVTATVRDQFGQLVGAGTSVSLSVIAGPNQGATDTCTTGAGGTCVLDYTDAAPFDANNATDTICVFITASGSGDCSAETPNETETGSGPNTEVLSGTGNDATDTVLKTWTAQPQTAATQVNAEPETDTNPVGTQHSIGASVRDANNNNTAGTPVRADILPGSPNANTGTGQAEITCAADTTPPAGVTFPAGQTQNFQCDYTSGAIPNSTGGPGTDTIRVFADTNGNLLFDQGEPFDDVTKTWSGQAFALALTPDSDTATAGTCNEFTVRVTDQGGNPVVGQTVDVQQVLQNAGTEPGETRELAFCNPPNATGPNPTGQGGTAFGDVSGNNQGQTAGQLGRNTTVHAEVGPTNNNGEVTFGITINSVPAGETATVSVRAWVDTGGDNDMFTAGEPTDQPSTKTWTAGGPGSVTTLNAEPESATNPNGTQHQVTVTMTGASGPIQGVTPNSIIATNAAGRPAGDVADANAGTSPNAAANQGNFNVYTCTASNAQGVSTCTFQDPVGTAAGTDTIVFYVNQAAGGTAGPDAGEPQDAVQKTWTAGPQNLLIDVQCAGTGTNDDKDVGETGPDNAGTPDCSNPVGDQDEVFTAIVTNAQAVGQQNIRIDWTFGQRTNGNQPGPNNSTNDATLNATPGGQVGTAPGGLQTFCLTDATGRCSVTLTNPTPVAGDTIEVVGTISGQTVPGPTADGATKQWQTGAVNQVGTLELTPPAATNQTGQQHTVTATVRNQFGQPVVGANVDFDITNGPNAGLAQAGMTDAVTDANGVASFTYTSNAVGTDTIEACTETGGSENDNCGGGEPTDTATKTWQTGAVTTAAVNLDMVSRVQDINGADTAADDCEVTTQANVGREKTAANQIDPNNALAATNFHEICAAAFQTTASAAPTAGAAITFTITGVGRLFPVGANERCSTATQPAAGTTLTVTAGSNGIARACLYSQQVGRTNVTASSGTPAQSDTGTKDWTVSPATARFIQLCHGGTAGTTCDTAESRNEPNDEHEMTARVTDAQGNPVANVPVQFRETGPGIFTPQGGGQATVLTDANGLAAVLLTSDVEGTSTIVAEIDPGNTTARQAGANNDQCEAPAGTNNQPPAGNCVSQTLTKVWDEADPPDPECDDGIDNDGDNLIDHPEDPGCADAQDNSELPFNEPEPDVIRHDRSIGISFKHTRDGRLRIKGRVRHTDAHDFDRCIRRVQVRIQKRKNDKWRTIRRPTTNNVGRYSTKVRDLAKRYRATTRHIRFENISANRVDTCKRAVKARRHRHRR